MPEYESWPGQIEASRMLFDTNASSKSGPRCYKHGIKWCKSCSWCKTAKQQRVHWEENKVKAKEHDRLLDEGIWDVQMLAQEIDGELITQWKNNPLTPRQMIEAATEVLATFYDLDQPVSKKRRVIPMQSFDKEVTEAILRKIREGER